MSQESQFAVFCTAVVLAVLLLGLVASWAPEGTHEAIITDKIPCLRLTLGELSTAVVLSYVLSPNFRPQTAQWLLCQTSTAQCVCNPAAKWTFKCVSSVNSGAFTLLAAYCLSGALVREPLHRSIQTAKRIPSWVDKA